MKPRDRPLPASAEGRKGAAELQTLALLSGAGCPSCRFLDQSRSKFFTWFRLEGSGEPAMLERLGESIGMCPRHTRRLVRELSGAQLASVYRFVVERAARSLDERRAARTCPACDHESWAVGHVRWLLLDTLDAAEVEQAYAAGGGLCLPHLLEALPHADLVRTELLVDVAVRSLEGAEGGPELVGVVGGADPDAASRRRLRAALPPEAGVRAESTLSQLSVRLEVQACPLCLGAGLMERRYLSWILETWELRETRRDVRRLCSQHLHDLAGLDGEVGGSLAAAQRDGWIGALGGLRDRLRRLPPRSPLARLRALPGVWREARAPTDGLRPPRRLLPSARVAAAAVARSQRRALGEARGPVLHGSPCPACSAARAAEERQAELLLRALRDGVTRERYARSHGVCLRHLRRLLPPAGPEEAVLRDVWTARRGLLAWELEEASRKSSWSYRHERRGPEASAWLRAPALLDGAAYLGGAAVAVRGPEPA